MAKGPLVNDLAQRALTLNKWEQKVSLRKHLVKIPRGTNPRILDFGCGTGLFIPTLISSGFQCTGLDIVPEYTAYASRLNPGAAFTNSLDGLARHSFDVILANSCFHHISDPDLETILARFRDLLKPEGRLLVIDILNTGRRSFLHDLFMKLERGLHIRSAAALTDIVRRHFRIIEASQEYGGAFSIRWRAFPFGNERLILQCR